jgi:SAM-dependent methyltransferase
MTEAIGAAQRPASPRLAFSYALFVVTVFISAGLVFLVQPMVAKLVLPLLGGSPAVWNTCMAFFQMALLAGYLYAHVLQRLRSVRTQAFVHLGVLLAAALVLPLEISGLLGDPDPSRPILWLLGVLALSIGAPFAVLSATAPLIQAWRARLAAPDDTREPYALYAASNLGSLLALIAYPVIIEPTLALHTQRLTWTIGYGVFVLAIALLGLLAIRSAGRAPTAPVVEATPVRWLDRLIWVALAAAPSSLMMGTTSYLSTDVASAPFLWVAPLALYLLTFIIAFQTKPLIGRDMALLLHAAAAAACAYLIPFETNDIVLQLAVHLCAFFLTALVCHQALVARRPPASQLTEFYLWMSVGGVIGGGFNAFLAPVIFNTVIEYPLVLVLAALARPIGPRTLPLWRWLLFVIAMATAISAAILVSFIGAGVVVKSLLAATVIAAFVLRANSVVFAGLLAILVVSATMVGDRVEVLQTWRSFFGVVRQSRVDVPNFANGIMMLSHGTTLHGAQAPAGPYGCKPLLYYAEETPIGQVFVKTKEERPMVSIGAVGLGTGTVSTYVRPTDKLTFFEIDPMMVKIASDPKHFSYISECADGPIDFVLGDARLTITRQPNDQYDILLIDAFSSDAVPAHLLTVEAVKTYLSKIKPDGIVILHLSNRNLDLRSPAQAVAIAAGGHALLQQHPGDPDKPFMWESGEDALIIARNEAALAPYISDPKWTRAVATVRPWTDDYTNLIGSLISQMKINWAARAKK